MSGWGAVTWDLARAGGLVAFGLLTISVAAGLLLSLRATSPRWPRLLTSELHGFLSLTALAFVVLHVAAVWLDPFTRFGLAEILVPFASHYRPLWMALGIVALDLILAVWLSTRLRPRIGYARWRRLHYLTFGIYAAALLHGLGTGTDTRTGWAQLIYASSATLVCGLIVARLVRPRDERRPARAAGAAAVVLAGVLGLLWAGQGPLRPGWNARANNGHGTGARGAAAALAPTATTAGPAATAPRPRPPADPFGRGFTARLVGLVRQTAPDQLGAVTIRLGTTLRREPPGLLEVVLQGPPLEGGGVEITATKVLLGTDPRQPMYRGVLTSLAGNDMTAQVARVGSAKSLRMHIVLAGIVGRRVRGTVVAVPSGA